MICIWVKIILLEIIMILLRKKFLEIFCKFCGFCDLRYIKIFRVC